MQYALALCALLALLSHRIAAAATPRLVFAHYMVGYTYLYKQADWARDIALASSAGIDAFALNIFWYADWPNPNSTLPQSTAWQLARCKDAAAVAAANSRPFKVFISFDASSQWPPSIMGQVINQTAQLPGQLVYNNKPLVSTFGGEQLDYGQANRSAGWQMALRDQLSFPITFVPMWTSLGPDSMNETVVDGVGSWAAWPVGNNTMTTELDAVYMQRAADLGGKIYMATASPMYARSGDSASDAGRFYRHFSDFNVINRGDDDLFGRRLQGLATMANPPQMIEIVTWNDLGESTYVGPVTTPYFDSITWVAGMDHTGWLEMLGYYSSWYKSGSPPTITADRMYACSRPNSKTIRATDDSIPVPYQWQVTDDRIYAMVWLTSNTPVVSASISVGGAAQTFSVGPGFSRLSVPYGLGNITIALIDKQNRTLQAASNAMAVSSTSAKYNFNYDVIKAVPVSAISSSAGSSSAKTSSSSIKAKSTSSSAVRTTAAAATKAPSTTAAPAKTTAKSTTKPKLRQRDALGFLNPRLFLDSLNDVPIPSAV